MAHTCVFGLYHCVFSTKERRNCISLDLQAKLWAYLDGIARQNGMQALAVGGTQETRNISGARRRGTLQPSLQDSRL